MAVSQKASTDARHEGSSGDMRPELRDNNSVSESNEVEVPRLNSDSQQASEAKLEETMERVEISEADGSGNYFLILSWR